MQVDLIVDGLIATTQIIERLLHEAFGRVNTIASSSLRGARLNGDLLVISRLCNPRLSWLPSYFRRVGRPYIYVLDDNFHELTDDYDPRNSAYYSHPAVQATLSEFINGASNVWVMSQPFAAYLRQRHPEASITCLPPPLDVPLFERLAPRIHRDDAVIRVGYPSSPKPNIEPLLQGLVKASEITLRGRVQFEFVGWCPDGISSCSNVSRFPHLPNYDDYVRFAQGRQWHIGIAPLSDSVFENCKTNVKYREYAALRVPGIYSDVPLYREDVRDGWNGLLAGATVQAWLEALQRLAADADLRSSVAHNANADVRERFAQAEVARLLRETFAAYASTRHGLNPHLDRS